MSKEIKKPEGETAEKPQPEQPAKPPVNQFISPDGHIRDRVIIHESQKIPKEGLFVSLNGYAFLIKPGTEVDLPRPVRLMLDSCVETETLQQDGKNFTRNIPRVTYTLVKEGVNLEKVPEQESFSE